MIFFWAGVGAAQQNNVIVPNVEGIAQGVAAQILRTAGLQPRVRQSANSGTLVVRQEPGPGYLLPIGSEVLLVTDTMSPATQAVPASRNVPAQTSAPAAGLSNTPTIQRNTGTNVSVTPVTTTTRSQAPQPGQSVVMQDASNFILVQQPQQTPANQYLLTETTPKRYPAWYPRAYLPNQGQATTVRTGQTQAGTLTPQVQPLVQSSVSPYLIQMQPVPQQRSSDWYAVPQGWAASQQAWKTQQTGQTQQVWTTQQQTWAFRQGYSTGFATQQPVYVQNQVMNTEAVPAPNVTRLSQADAMLAIQKAGLVVGNVTLVQNAQTGAGFVAQQSPRPRSIVRTGSRVDLWIAN